MRLFAKVSDPELFLRSLNAMGTAFYRPVKGEIVEAIYFIDELSLQQYEMLKAQVHLVTKFGIDERRGTIEVDQLQNED